jgi:hypothetical protein
MTCEEVEKPMDALAHNFAATHDIKTMEEIGTLKEPWRFVVK